MLYLTALTVYNEVDQGRTNFGGRAILVPKFYTWWRIIFMISLYVTCLMSPF
jgi:hypothetical protein